MAPLSFLALFLLMATGIIAYGRFLARSRSGAAMPSIADWSISVAAAALCIAIIIARYA